MISEIKLINGPLKKELSDYAIDWVVFVTMQDANSHISLHWSSIP